jgi:hypothetical protein
MPAGRLVLAFGSAAAYLAVWSVPGFAAPCAAAIGFGASFAGSYTCTTLGSPTGVAAQLGGITFLDSNTLLIGGSANNSGGVIDEIGRW